MPEEPVRKKACIYRPRVLGARVGQSVEIINSDDWLHNLPASSRRNNSFKVGQPVAGLLYRFEPMDVEVMVSLRCDVHRWMRGYIGVLDYPYFSVTEDTGTFEISDVPAGTDTIHMWHEVYGELTQALQVTAGSTSAAEFIYDTE